MKFVLKCVFCHDQNDHEKAWNEAKVHQLLQNSEDNHILNLIDCEMIEKLSQFTKNPTDVFLMLLPYYKVSVPVCVDCPLTYKLLVNIYLFLF